MRSYGVGLGIVLILSVAGLCPPVLGEVPSAPTVVLDRALHFRTAEGVDVSVAPGTYLVERSGERQLRLQAEGQAAVTVEAQPTTHEEPIGSPYALYSQDEQKPDLFHVEVVLPGGTGVDAVGSVSGVVSRSAVTAVARARIQTQESAATAAGKAQIGVSTTDPTALKLEENTNRPGGDYRNFPHPQVSACYMACKGDPQCKAATFVKPAVQGGSGRCWLKNTVPTVQPNACCVTFVKPEPPLPGSPQPPPAAGTAQARPDNCPGNIFSEIYNYPSQTTAVEKAPYGPALVNDTVTTIQQSFRPGCWPITHVAVIGYADRSFSTEFEDRTSIERAKSVADAISAELKRRTVIELDVPEGYPNLTDVAVAFGGLGARDLVNPNATAEADRARNRRAIIYAYHDPLSLDGGTSIITQPYASEFNHTLLSCRTVCAKEPRCRGFSWITRSIALSRGAPPENTGPGMCYFHDKLGVIQPRTGGEVSGIKQPTP